MDGEGGEVQGNGGSPIMTLKNSTRKKVFEQEGHECLFCGVTSEEHEEEYGRDLDVHHVIPKRKGGSNEPSNLIPVCISCHRTLESTQGEALGRIANEEMDSQKMAALERKNKRLQRELDEKEETILNILSGVSILLESSLSTAYYIVHASKNYNSESELVYAGCRFPRASEEFSNSDNRPTMEQKSIHITPEDAISTEDIKIIRTHSGVLADSISEHIKAKEKALMTTEDE
jgi:hypothetical protein